MIISRHHDDLQFGFCYRIFSNSRVLLGGYEIIITSSRDAKMNKSTLWKQRSQIELVTTETILTGHSDKFHFRQLKSFTFLFPT
jgi:hypothetical protein